MIKNSDGGIVRVLLDEEREPGSYQDAWDGLGEGSKRLKDGQYFWVASFRTGSAECAIDMTARRDGDSEVKSHPEYSGWNPFDNQPLRVSHSFERAGELSIVFSPRTYYVRLTCEAPQFCRHVDGFQPGGEFTYEWAGVDETGALRADIRGIFVISHHEDLAKNGIVVYGGRPALSGLRVDPPVLRPGLEMQEIGLSIGTYGGEHARIVVTLTNQESRSVLRTMRLEDVAPGAVKLRWDGRGDNGALVSPGAYTVRVVATSALGEAAQAEILTRVEY